MNITTYNDLFSQLHWEEIKDRIYSCTTHDVERALAKEKLSVDDFAALISPAAAPYLEQMAQRSHALTLKRFGNTIQMYVPMYLSNECQNICTYCGFSFDNKIARKTLTDEEILREVEVVKSYGYDHILLVTGEANRTVGVDYMVHAIELLRPHFSNISIEVQPLEQDEYSRLIDAGIYAVLVYQETYHKENYKLYHPKGKKSNFEYRLDTADRLGKAGIHKIGLGVLIGLEDWRVDSFLCASHLNYLEKKYWQTKFSLSFPRLRPAEGVDLKAQADACASDGRDSDLTTFEKLSNLKNSYMSDKELVQLICAYRIFNENLELSLSTRESATFRNHVIKLGITSISAGSKTDPGGYANTVHALEQFEISDDRTPQEVADMIREQGYEPVWKDWEQLAVNS